MANLERKLPKIAAFTAPFALGVAAISTEACTNSQQTEPTIPTPVTRSPEGVVNPAFSDPTRGSTIEVIEPTQEPKGNTVTFTSGSTKYELYTGIEVADMIETSNLLPETPAKESILNNLQGVQTALRINPEDTTVVLTLNRVINMVDANCEGEESKELTKEIASYVHENHPDQYEGTRKLAEQGPCSVLEENQVTAPENNENLGNLTSLEPFVDRFGSITFTAIKNGYAYTYKLTQYEDPDISSAFLGLQDYIIGNNLITDPQKRNPLLEMYEDIQNFAAENPNSPEIPKKILSANLALKEICDGNTGLLRLAMGTSSSLINAIDPKFWKEKQFALLDDDCLRSRKYVISPEFEIVPHPDGTFTYDGVTYDNLITYVQNLRPIYREDTFNNLVGWINHAKNNQGNSQEEAHGLNSAGFILNGACERSDVAFNAIRLMASVGNNNSNDSYYVRCHQIFFNDDYWFEGHTPLVKP